MNKEDNSKVDENKEEKINWKALDEHWKNDYEETYGHFFGVNIVTSEYP